MVNCNFGILEAFLSILSIIEFILSIVVLALDITFLVNIGNSTTFAYKQLLDVSIYLSSVMASIMVFGIIYSMSVVVKVTFLSPCFNNKHSGNKTDMIRFTIQAISLLFIESIRQSLYIKMITCINNYYQDTLRARSILAIIMMILTLVSTVVYIIKQRLSDLTRIHQVITIVAYISCILVPIAVIAINIAALVVLKPGDAKPIFPSDIQLGFFNKTEVLSIQNGQYTKDSFYSNRIVANLERVMNSRYTRYAYTDCTTNSDSSTSCYSYYYRITFATIDCSDSQNKVFFYEDCLNATKLYFRIEYLDDKSGYPSYYCGKDSTSKFCELGCYSALKYTMLMVQESNNTLIYPWSNYSTCSAQPSVTIPVDLTINACLLSSRSARQTFNYILHVISLMFCFNSFSLH